MGALSEKVDAMEKARAGGGGGRHRAGLFFDLGPHWHRIQAHVFARQAGQEQLTAEFALERRTKDVRNLESALIIYAGLLVASKHTRPLKMNHFFPQISTEILWDDSVPVNRKLQSLSKLRQIFAF